MKFAVSTVYFFFISSVVPFDIHQVLKVMCAVVFTQCTFIISEYFLYATYTSVHLFERLGDLVFEELCQTVLYFIVQDVPLVIPKATCVKDNQ